MSNPFDDVFLKISKMQDKQEMLNFCTEYLDGGQYKKTSDRVEKEKKVRELRNEGKVNTVVKPENRKDRRRKVREEKKKLKKKITV
jgi:hypothetical protein